MAVSAPTALRIPSELLPGDGRFGSGPSKVRPEAVAALTAAGTTLLGTSHRQEPVRGLVRRIRGGLADLLGLPGDWEILLGNGGSTSFWDAASFGLIEHRSQHLRVGEFSARFAEIVGAAPHLGRPDLVDAPVGERRDLRPEPGVDTYALPQNETSTGVVVDVRRPAGADPGALVLVDATSAAGAVPWDPAQADVYYFAPQKVLASDGGLWLAACAPVALDRITRLSAGRWAPPSLDLAVALTNSRLDQTLNTPALATLVLLDAQLTWLLDHGGMTFAAGRSAASAAILYGWAEARSWAEPFVGDPAARSPVVGTIDLDGTIDAPRVAAVLRANGVVDTEPYRKLGRNQLRIGMYPAVEPADVEALTACIDWVVAALA